MIIVYDSLTGMSARFAAKLGYPIQSVKETDLLSEPCLLVTRSFGFGKITEDTRAFLNSNAKSIVGVVVSGNLNWGSLYGNAGRLISEEYNIPLIHIFEGSGFDKDIKLVRDFLEAYNGSNT